MRFLTTLSGSRFIAFLLFLALFLCVSEPLAAQSSTTETAFSNSYSAEKKGDYAKALKYMIDVYQASSYEINLREGWLLYNQGLYKESIEYYRKAIELLPYGIEARFGIIYPESALGNWENVLQQYLAILKVDPSNSTVNYRIGQIYYNRKDYQKAIPYLQKVVNLYPFSYDGVLLLAWANLNSGNFKEAKILFNRTLLISPGDTSAADGLKKIN